MAKTKKDPDDFWLEYEEKTGEKVLSHGLGRYMSGWEEFDSRGWTSIWGLIIASSGGFRFHHFPQKSWLEALSNFSGRNEPKEKTIFIPKEKITSALHIAESKWWKKLLKPVAPMLVIQYLDEAENERKLLLEADIFSDRTKPENFVKMLCASLVG